MAKRIVIREDIPDRNGGLYTVRYKAPKGMSADEANRLSEAAIDELEQFVGDPTKLSGDCGLISVPTPPTNPTAAKWKDSVSFPDLEAGAVYQADLLASYIENLPTNVTVAQFVVTGGSLSYLETVLNAMPSRLYGNVPAGAVAGTVIISARLSNGQNVDKQFSLGVKTVSDLYGVLQTSSSNIIVRIGPDSSAPVSIKAVVFPSGFTQTSQYAMSHGSGDVIDALDRKKTYFTYVYNSPIAGRYVFEVKRGDLTRYVVCTYDPNRNSETLIITFQAAIPEPGDEIGALMVVVNSDRTVSLSVVASKQVQVTPPYPKGGTATAYVDMSKEGSTYRRTTAALTPGSYVGTYRLAGNATEYGYGFAIDKTTLLAIDRIDTDNGQTTELLAKASFNDGVQFQQATYLDNGSLGDYTDWADMGPKTDTQGYQYTALGGYQSGKLYKKRYQFRPATNPSAVIGLDVQQLATNQVRRTVYPTGTAPASNDGNITETFTYSTVN